MNGLKEKEEQFTSEAAEIRQEIEILAGYGFDTSQAIEFLKLMTLNEISCGLSNGGLGGSVSDSLASIAETLEDCHISDNTGHALAIRGTVDTVSY